MRLIQHHINKLIPWNSTLLLVLFLCTAMYSHAQSSSALYLPLEIQKAYAKGTRSMDGKPGPNYWQNHSDYQIKAELIPTTRQLKGEETVTYYNQSNDTLRDLVIRLYPDIFKKGNARDEDIDPSDVTDGVSINLLKINDNTLYTKGSTGSPARTMRRSSTNLTVRLPQALYPKSSVSITIQWEYVIPAKTHIREGMYGDNTFMVAYWYPQIAVYDDVHGWDRLEYGGQTEFYNDFCTFDVTIQVPQDFLVWATGVWQNPAQILTKSFLDKYQNAQKSSDITHIVTQENLDKGGITQGKGKLTYQFKAENVPDFVFATSNQYLWDATSALADASTNRRTAISAVYNPASRDFYEVARYAQQSVEFFSSQMPGVPYPYPNLTIFNGSGGMEFPMFVNDGSFPPNEAAEVTAHEIAHTYFPFYMGINERRYAWMDEGWAQFLPNEIPFQIGGKTFYPQQFNAMYFASASGRELEMPLMIPSTLLDHSFAYTMASYMRSSTAYATLEDLLGKEKFKQVLQEYMRRWNGKHPLPYDFFFSFNDAAKEDLSWFWKPWFFEAGYGDMGVKNVENGKTAKITISRNGTLPLPLYMTITFADGTTETLHETARIWKEGVKEFVLTKKFAKPIQKVQLGHSKVPDVNGQNNVYQVK